MLTSISQCFSSPRRLNKIVSLFSIKTKLSHSKLHEIRKETIEMLEFFTFSRSFGKQCFAVVDSLFIKLLGILSNKRRPRRRGGELQENFHSNGIEAG